MEKEIVFQLIDDHYNLYPEAIPSLVNLLKSNLKSLKKSKLPFVEDRYVVSELTSVLYKRTPLRIKTKVAITLKILSTENPGKNIGMPHLKDLHPVNRSGHFRTLCKYHLIAQNSPGTYMLLTKGWEILERAYEHEKEDKQKTGNSTILG